MASGNGFGYEAGVNGDALTSGNTGADSIVTTGGTAVISTAQAMHGTRSALYTATSTSGGLYQQEAIVGTDAIAVRLYVRFSAYPSTDTGMIWLGNGTSQLSHVEVTSTGAVRLRDDANAAQWISGGPTTSAGVMSLNTWYRIELILTRDPSAGTFHLRVYPGDGTTPVTNMDSGARTAVNTGAAQITTLRIGAKTSTGATTSTVYLDDWDYDPAQGTTEIGPYVDVLPQPNLSIASQVGPSTVGGSDGSIQIAWDAVAGSSGYEVAILSGTVTTGFDGVAVADAASPHDFTALAAGTYTVAVRAKG